MTLVNPELAAHGEEVEIDDEGCLSLQGLLVPVERPTTVTVTAKDPAGEPVKLELEGFAARAGQHELDHLDGVLMIDRTTDEAPARSHGHAAAAPALGATVLERGPDRVRSDGAVRRRRPRAARRSGTRSRFA